MPKKEKVVVQDKVLNAEEAQQEQGLNTPTGRALKRAEEEYKKLKRK